MKQDEQKPIAIDMSFIILAVIFLGVGFSIYVFWGERDREFTAVDEVIADLAVECENGAWVEFPVDKTWDGKTHGEAHFSGVIQNADDDDVVMTDAKRAQQFFTHEDYSLIFYNGRDVEIAGTYATVSDTERIYVTKIRCIGTEAQKDVQNSRQQIMSYVTQNLTQILRNNQITGAFEIEDITFVDENIIYVYVSEDAEEEGKEAILLMQMNKEAEGYGMITLAVYELQNDAFVLREGEDRYKDHHRSTYEYDDDLGRWVLSW